MSTYVSILIIGLLVGIAALILLDVVFGFGMCLVFRVKRYRDKYYVQSRWIINPFWSLYGKGDILGSSFYPFEFETREEAEDFIVEELENGT